MKQVYEKRTLNNDMIYRSLAIERGLLTYSNYYTCIVYNEQSFVVTPYYARTTNKHVYRRRAQLHVLIYNTDYCAHIALQQRLLL